ncbi:MAG: 2-hydroxyacid dehydrogenase [Bdellovibrionota bacterium]|nr:MAG: 2-hydroxyacid dehydrogenase [Bdellovibrionota bacterium]
MKVAFFDTHRFDRTRFEAANAKLKNPHDITFLDARLSWETAVLAEGWPCICVFVNDKVDGAVVKRLAEYGVRLIALRSAGYNHVDLQECARQSIRVVRVPAYSPHAVAEHALSLLLCLNRKIHRAYQRVRELNFSLDGLEGFDLYGKTVGVVGTGAIGSVFARIMSCLGCTVLAVDKIQNKDLVAQAHVHYVQLDELCRRSDVISLHVPLVPETRHVIDAKTIEQMKQGVIIINTGRGALIDTKALIDALKAGKVGAAGLDVYEEEEGVFFFNLSDQVLQDDVLARLLTFPNVLVTAHQGFLTHEAVDAIAQTTLGSITQFELGAPLAFEVRG